MKANSKTTQQSEAALTAAFNSLKTKDKDGNEIETGKKALAEIAEHNAPLLAKIAADKKLQDPNLLPDQIRDFARQSKKGDEIVLSSGEKIKIVDKTYDYDGALGQLIKLVHKFKYKGILGFVLAALLGAIVSSLAAVLNATSTLFTMDIYQRYMRPEASQKEIVTFGRLTIVVLLVIGIVVASVLDTESIFKYIQEMQLYVSPGIVAVFIFGLINRKGARWIGALALLISPIIYFLLSTYGWSLVPGCASFVPQVCGCVVENGVVQPMHYLWAASYNLIITLIIMFVLGAIFKMPEEVTFESNTKLDMKFSKAALAFGLIVVAMTVALYVYFW